MSSLKILASGLNSFTGLPFGIAAFLLITPGFFALRFFGQGILTMVSRNMVMKWFDKKRGLAAALMGVITAFGFSYAPKPFNRLIISYSWEGAWKILGLAALLIVPFFIMFFIEIIRKYAGSNLTEEQANLKKRIRNL